MRERTTCRSECTSPCGAAIGFVTNQPNGYESGRAHMSQVVCPRPECRRRAERQVLEFTGEPGTFCEFEATE